MYVSCEYPSTLKKGRDDSNTHYSRNENRKLD